VDKVADVRQLHEIAELGKPESEPTKGPRLMRLTMTPGQPRIEGDDLDFRDELYAHIFKPGETHPTGSVEFDVSVSDSARRSGVAPFRRVKVSAWRKIGRVTFTEAVASYNADHVVQFHHPGWRDDRDDPSTAIPFGRETSPALVALDAGVAPGGGGKDGRARRPVVGHEQRCKWIVVMAGATDSV